MIEQPILITGAARSGTSMVAGVIDKCGVFGGNTSGPNLNNQKGMFENNEIRNDVVKPILRGMGCDPMGQNPLPTDKQLQEFGYEQALRLRERVVATMKRQGLGERQRWYYKGAKMCLIWPLWNMAFPGAKWIIVRRGPGGIVDSCIRTSFMRAYDTREGWMEWLSVHLMRFEEMQRVARTRMSVHEIWPERLIEGDFEELEHVVRWLGLELTGAARAHIEPKLWEVEKVWHAQPQKK